MLIETRLEPSTFSHPDYTVGAGISPGSCLSARGLLVTEITAGRELVPPKEPHHAPKVCVAFLIYSMSITGKDQLMRIWSTESTMALRRSWAR